jgi:prolyl-tRNA editing enzyme YbaK/EbsC (Cys-tRNA(Pro) deacylase)
MIIADLKQLLTDQNADFEVLTHDKPIHSKQDALGYFKLEETAPTLILETENGYLALIISGEREKVNFRQLKKLTNSKKLQLANPDLMQETMNLKAGQIPLIGHQLPCIIDKKLFNYSYVYGGTGDLFHTLKIKPDDLVKANQVILKFD